MFYIVAFTNEEVADKNLRWHFQNQLESAISKEEMKKIEWANKQIPFKEEEVLIYSTSSLSGDYDVYMFLNETAKNLAHAYGISARFIGQVADDKIDGFSQNIKAKIPVIINKK